MWHRRKYGRINEESIGLHRHSPVYWIVMVWFLVSDDLLSKNTAFGKKVITQHVVRVRLTASTKWKSVTSIFLIVSNVLADFATRKKLVELYSLFVALNAKGTRRTCLQPTKLCMLNETVIFSLKAVCSHIILTSPGANTFKLGDRPRLFRLTWVCVGMCDSPVCGGNLIQKEKGAEHCLWAPGALWGLFTGCQEAARSHFFSISSSFLNYDASQWRDTIYPPSISVYTIHLCLS